MKLKINITREILEKSMYCGRGNNSCLLIPSNCAFAVALRDIFPDVMVFLPNIHLFGRDDYENRVRVTEPMRMFITKFDTSTPSRRIKIPEQSFEIEIPDSVISKIGLKELDNILSTSQTLEKVC